MKTIYFVIPEKQRKPQRKRWIKNNLSSATLLPSSN